MTVDRTNRRRRGGFGQTLRVIAIMLLIVMLAPAAPVQARNSHHTKNGDASVTSASTPQPTATVAPPAPTAAPSPTPVPAEPTQPPAPPPVTETATSESTAIPAGTAAVATAEPSPATTTVADETAQTAGFVFAAALTYTPSLTLTPGTTVVAGTSVRGQGGGTFGGPNPTGAVSYTIYNGAGCTGALFANGGVSTMSGGTPGASSLIAFPTVGVYSWNYLYAGDVTYSAASICVDLTVNKTSPAVGLTVSPNPVAYGGNATAAATLTGATATAGGSITYTVYSDNTCTTQFSATGNPSTKTVTNAAAPASTAVTFTTAGTHYWRASYTGDANNNAAVSTCTAFTVNKVSPALGLTVDSINNTMRAGGAAYGSSTLSGETATAGGNVTYTVYADAACTTVLPSPNSPSTVTVSNGNVPDSANITINVAGTVYWQAVYTGDPNNNGDASPCVSLSVAKARSKLSLTVSPAVSPMKAGGSASGNSTLTRATTTAGGTVTYTVYTNKGCSNPFSVSGNPSTVTVTNRTVPSSAAITFNTATNFYWRAAYSGDDNNNAATSGCVRLRVAKATPALSLTIAPNPVTIGGSASASALLTGASANAGGTVTYTVYTDNACSTQLTATGNPSTQTVTNTIVPASAAITFTSAGALYWYASYAGDANNNAATSICTAFTVTKTTTTLTLSVTPDSSPMIAGGTATGTTTLAGATATASGNVLYTIYTDNGCTTPVSPNQQVTKAVTNGVVPSSGAITFANAGAFYWNAVYSGDASNLGDTSSCVALTVLVTAASSVSLSVAPNPIVAGGSTTGSATLSGVTATAGGTVVYTVYTDNSCLTAVSPARQATQAVTNGAVANSGAFTFTSAGSFYWNAIYSGDANNASATSPCLALTVAKASPVITLSIAPNPVAAGAAVTGSATLTGGASAPSGTAIYTVYTNNACTTPVTPAQQSSVTVSGGVTPNSATLTFLATGAFYWQIAYAGDANNNPATSACLALTVTKATPVLTMTQSPVVVLPNGSFTEQFALTGAANPTGTVTITTYDDSGCTEVNPDVSAVTLILAGGLIPDAPAVTYAFADDAYRQASYSGDANNEETDTACQLIVVAQDPGITLTLSPSNSIARGSSASVAAVWPSANTPTGTVTYTLFASVDCTGTVVSGPEAKSIDAIANSVPAASVYAFANAGAYSWRAAYSGDADYIPTLDCTVLTVTKSTPAAGLAITPSAITVWDSVAASATLSGASANADGTVTYTVYADSACTSPTSPARTSTKAVTNGAVPTSDAFTFDRAGSVYWQAAYTGDANNNPAASACTGMSVAAGALTASVSGVALPVVAYSTAAQANSGTLVLTVSDQRGSAAGWSVSVSSSEFAYSGTSPAGIAIPASAFRITSVSGATSTYGQAVDGGGGPAAPAAGGTGTLDQPVTVLVASAGYGAGTYQQSLAVTLTIPANSQAGTYTAVIQVVTSSAP